MISYLLLNLLSFPEVGNYARYEAQYKGQIFELKKMLIEYNENKDSFLLVTKLSQNEEVISEDYSELPRMWFYSREKVESVLKNCHRREGARENVLIHGQKIEACTFHNEDAQLDYTIGMVPYGQIRFQSYLGKGEFLDFYLKDFN